MSSRSTSSTTAARSVTCSRTSNAELFSLAIGGYGLFGRDRAGHAAAGAAPQGRAPRDDRVRGQPAASSSTGAFATATSSATASSRPTRRRRSSCRRACSPATGRSRTTYPMPDDQRVARRSRLAAAAAARPHGQVARVCRVRPATTCQPTASCTGPTRTSSPATSTAYHDDARPGARRHGQGQRDDLRALRPPGRSPGVHDGGPRRRAAARR